MKHTGSKLLQCNVNFALHPAMRRRPGKMTIVLRSDDMRRRNRLRIVEIVRRGGTVSRGEIAQSAALSPATVSTISSELIAEGVLIARSVETGLSAGRGRPSASLSINPQFCHAVLIILKIGAVNVAIVDYAGTVIAREHFHLDMANVAMSDFRETLITEIHQTWERSGLATEQLGRISIGVQGTTDIAGLKLLRSPMTPLTDIPVAFWLEEEFGVPVRLANDCDLIARALNWRDPERYSDNFAAILLAHGVGMGLFLRGQIINGTRSSGTEFGHMLHQTDGALCRCGSNGCIEADAGDYAITRRYRGQTGSRGAAKAMSSRSRSFASPRPPAPATRWRPKPSLPPAGRWGPAWRASSRLSTRSGWPLSAMGRRRST